ncbi:hypothetical protein V5O48_015845 [Marasmius crinis-equi]|uniref:Uncharacterized protein n=1 Tax=Marasmius crinis-equi TaxID=585013 RepID=A0ABR3ETE3_9AGAR
MVNIAIVSTLHDSKRECRDRSWVQGVFKASRRCSESLEILRMEVPYEMEAHQETPVTLSRLRVFTGPEGLLSSFVLNGPLSTLWVTTNGPSSSPPMWVALWPSLHNLHALRMLRVGLWDVTVLPIVAVLSSLPHLEQLSFLTNLHLTKNQFAALGGGFSHAPFLKSVSVFTSGNYVPTGSDAIEVANAWRMSAPNLSTVRFDNTKELEYHYQYEDHRFEWEVRDLPYVQIFRKANIPVGLQENHMVLPLVDADLDRATPLSEDPLYEEEPEELSSPDVSDDDL